MHTIVERRPSPEMLPVEERETVPFGARLPAISLSGLTVLTSVPVPVQTSSIPTILHVVFECKDIYGGNDRAMDIYFGLVSLDSHFFTLLRFQSTVGVIPSNWRDTFTRSIGVNSFQFVPRVLKKGDRWEMRVERNREGGEKPRG